jgi:hypothetical protein
MITEDDLRDSLRALDRLAPDPAAVAARITAGVRTRDRRRTAVLVAAAAGTAVAVVLPVALLGGDGSGTTAAAPARTAGTPTRASTSVPAATRFDPLTVPFTVGWLPAGYHRDGTASAQPGLALRLYEGARADDGIAVQLWDTTVSGRSASDVGIGGTVVRRHVLGNVWLGVAGSPGRDVLNRVLASVDLGRDDALTFPFRLTWVPAGYRTQSASSGAHHWYGTGSGAVLAADPPLLDAGLTLDPRPAIPATEAGALSIGVSTEDGSAADKGLTPNGTLLGHPSRYTKDRDGLADLHVYGVNGMHIGVSADTRGRPELTRAALERVVTGLRLVSDPADPATWTPDPLP